MKLKIWILWVLHTVLFILSLEAFAEVRYWREVYTDHFYSKDKAVSLGHSSPECFDENQFPLICTDIIGVERPCLELEDYEIRLMENFVAHEHLNRCSWKIYSHFNYMVGRSDEEKIRQNTFLPHHVAVDPSSNEEGEGFLILSAEYESDRGDFTNCGFNEISDLYQERDWDNGSNAWKPRTFETESCPIVSGAIDARKDNNRTTYLRDIYGNPFDDFEHPGHQQTYGRFEARIKMPRGEGAWPAFWMVPQHMWRKHSEEMPIPYAPPGEYCSWPYTGEIDIVELWDRTDIDKVYGSWHSGVCKEKLKSTSQGKIVIENTSKFNLYAVEWDEGSLRFYINNILYHDLTCTRNGEGWSCPKLATKHMETKESGGDWETYIPHDPFYIILNLSIENVRRPQDFKRMEMIVDYVKTYQQCSGPDEGCQARSYFSDMREKFEKKQVLQADNHRAFQSGPHELTVQTNFITVVPDQIQYQLIDGSTGQILGDWTRMVSVRAGEPLIDLLPVQLPANRFLVLRKLYQKDGLRGQHSHKLMSRPN